MQWTWVPLTRCDECPARWGANVPTLSLSGSPGELEHPQGGHRLKAQAASHKTTDDDEEGNTKLNGLNPD